MVGRPHQLMFVVRVGPVAVGCVAVVGWPHRLAFVVRVGPASVAVGCVMSGRLAPPTHVCSEGGACVICRMSK